MQKSVKLLQLTSALLVIAITAGCETRVFSSGGCQWFKMVQAPYERGTPEFNDWWDNLEATLGEDQSAVIRGNNGALIENCQ